MIQSAMRVILGVTTVLFTLVITYKVCETSRYIQKGGTVFTNTKAKNPF